MRHLLLSLAATMPRFQSTHPVWGATLGIIPQLRRYIFQSTHPVWGATNTAKRIWSLLTFQSTHPVWGATLVLCHRRRRCPNFNPRTPCGVRHVCSCGFSRCTYFNPRTPCGVRLQSCSSNQPDHSSFQSTHPVWGATLSFA